MVKQPIEIPDAMYETIMTIIKEDPALGYEFPDEFVREAIRNFLITYAARKAARRF